MSLQKPKFKEIIIFLCWFVLPVAFLIVFLYVSNSTGMRNPPQPLPHLALQIAADGNYLFEVHDIDVKDSGIFVYPGDCFIKVNSGELVDLSRFFVNGKLKIIIDDKVYWIKLEEEGKYK